VKKALKTAGLVFCLLSGNFTHQMQAATSGGLFFDGLNDYVTFGATPLLGLSNFTLETWFKWQGGGQTASSSSTGGITVYPLIAKGRSEADGDNRDCNYLFGILPSGILAADFEEGANGTNPGLNHPIQGVTPITSNIWHHAAVTYDGTNWALYLDGVLENSLTVGQPPRYDSIHQITLGTTMNSQNVTLGAFSGVLDEVRIWNYARTAADIANNMNREIPSAPGLVGRWGLNETSGTTAADSSGNALNGTLVNGPVWTNGFTNFISANFAITLPVENAVFIAPAQIPVQVQVSSELGAISQVVVYERASELAVLTSAPYQMTWSNVAAGPYFLRAVATTTHGASYTSAPVHVLVYATNQQWMAFNDHVPGPLTHSNATAWNLFGNAPGSSGPLKNVVTGTPVGATLTLQNSGATSGTLTLEPTAGTPAWQTFYGYVDFTNSTILLDGSASATYVFSGLNPGRRYSVKGTAVRGNSAYTNRWTLVEITGADSFSPAHTTNVLTSVQVPASLATNQAAFNAGFNLSGDMVAWKDINPGADGSFSLVARMYTGQVPGGTSSGATHTYAPICLLLEEFTATTQTNLNPVIASFSPPAGTVSNLTAIQITFDKPVFNVDAADLLVNGTPATGLSGGGSNYTFTFPQPTYGTVNISWAANHGIVDAGGNPFNSSTSTWTYTLVAPRVYLVASNAYYRWFRGTNEASTPISAWRMTNFNDANWELGQAPFYYERQPGSAGEVTGNTALNDMYNGYMSVYLRHTFVITNLAALSNVVFRGRCDDGFIAWLNGNEIARIRISGTDPAYNAAADNAPEPVTSSLYNVPVAYFQTGTNVLAIHAFNQALTSSDFLMDMDLASDLVDPTLLPPQVQNLNPPPGTVYALTNLTVTFSKPVTGVDASDLLVNGQPALALSGSNATYTFVFSQPPYGNVTIAWATGHGIVDLGNPPQGLVTASYTYRLVNPNAPVIASRLPAPGATVNQLTQIEVTFNKAVTNVDASDLLINGQPATSINGGPQVFTFAFPQPAYGNVAITWAVNHNIRDATNSNNLFDGSATEASWQITLVDQTPPTIVSVNPPPGSEVTNLTQVTVTFSEPVLGVDAADLLVSGVPALSLSGSGAVYTFSFPQPNSSVIQFTWRLNHGITDTAPVPNAFQTNSPGANWFYMTTDNVPPTVAELVPAPNTVVRSLGQVTVLFSEPVTGVDASDLLVNGTPAQAMSGSGAGPYVFAFPQPSTGLVQLAWAPGHGIRDLAVQPNDFAGGSWTCVLDPNASYAGAVIISEIMYHQYSENSAEEYIELYNTTPNPINLNGWRFNRGVNFTFTNIVIPGHGYFVVAANLAAFRAKYPDVTNVIGDWNGQLSNIDEEIQLVDSSGALVNRVHYADQGEWAVRLQGAGEDKPFSLSNSGSTATAVFIGHYSSADTMVISGADQPEFNGTYSIYSVVVNGSAANTGFSYTMAGTGNKTATGPIVIRQLSDLGYVGWSWSSRADGLGSSLELVNPAIPNVHGQNWRASSTTFGTPGRPNSVAVTNSAPLILDVVHSPAVPKPSDTVTITARILDEQTNGLLVQVFYRDHTTTSPGNFTALTMYDDGQHGDGLAGDGLYGAFLPAQANGTVVEFYVRAEDALQNARTWPAPALMANGSFAQAANALYQVDDNLSPASQANTNQPFHRIIMTGTEWQTFQNINHQSDAEMNATFISQEGSQFSIRYNTGIRIRGAGSRGCSITNFRLNIPTDRRYNGLSGLNLNSQYHHAQLLGSVVSQKAGLPCARGRTVQVRLNGNNMASPNPPSNGSSCGGSCFGSYLELEPYGTDWVNRALPNNGGGNLYRGSKYPWNANLDYIGTNFVTYVMAGYSKNSNQGENDWTDLFDLTYVLSPNTPDTNYVREVRRRINVEMWMRYFAVANLLEYSETSLCNGVGDDYAMYRGLQDTRFILLPHDFDTILGQGDASYGTASRNFNMTESIWVMIDKSPAGSDTTMKANFQSRFLRHPEFAPIYFRELKRLCDTVLSPEQFNPMIDNLLGGWVDSANISSMKSFMATRRESVLSQIPMTFSVSVPLTASNSYYIATSGSVTITGQANAIETATVRVNGANASYTVWQGAWSASVNLLPGFNNVLVQCLDTNQMEVARTNLVIWYDQPATPVAGQISGAVTWTAAGGPYQVTSTVTVGNGASLTIQPGTTVYFATGAGITVTGTGVLHAEGTESQHIRFTSIPGGGNWGALDFINASQESRLAFVDIDSCGGTTVSGHNAKIHVNNSKVFFDHLVFANTPAVQYISFDNSSFIVQNCVFPTYPAAVSAPEMLHGVNGIPPNGYAIFRDNYFGHTYGFNDTIDFTGGNRPGPILKIINNIFDGASDDHLDLDSTDAWIEGNIFMHVHRDPNRTDDPLDTASAISGGVDVAGQYSEWTIINNLFYDVDHAVLVKQGNRFIFANNTIVHVAKENGSGDTNDIAAFNFTDKAVALPSPSLGAGAYIANNVIWDCQRLVANYNPTNYTVIFEDNILPIPWSGPGSNNLVTDPRLNLGLLTNPLTATWQTVQAALKPMAGSPAIGTGKGGFDRGGFNQRGLLVYGEPLGAASDSTLTLNLWPAGLFNWGSVVPPYWWGYTHYKWKLDDGPWSAEIAFTNAPQIVLSNLYPGQHQLHIVGKNDAGFYQDDPFVYPLSSGLPAHTNVSRTFTTLPGVPALRLNEILASNRDAYNIGGASPDVIELFNAGQSTISLEGIGITDNPQNPYKYRFPAGITMNPGAYLIVFADNNSTPPGIHLGFNLNQEGEGVYLFDSINRGGRLLDSVVFGPQLTDYSIGRLGDGSWTLTQPTIGAVNIPAALGDPHYIKINEWLANSVPPNPVDFIELYNPTTLPVAVGGLFLTDDLPGYPDRHAIAALSFIPPYGYLNFLADGSPSQGPLHLNFQLAAERGEIALSDSSLQLIDAVFYSLQTPGVSQGRSPNGSTNIISFIQPTPGAGNPYGGSTGPQTETRVLVDITQVWLYNESGIDLGMAWKEVYYPDETNWPSGPGLLGQLTPTRPQTLPEPINTQLHTNYGKITFYFRTHFQAPTNGTVTALSLVHIIDDGAVFYINGHEINYRFNMNGQPGSPVAFSNVAASVVPDAVYSSTIALSPTNIVPGENVLAVEVHQSSIESSDVAFALRLTATVVTNTPTPSSVVINELLADNAGLTNADGTVTDWVELYNKAASPVDLSGASLVLGNNSWTFPSGTTISPEGYLLILCDPARPASTNSGGLLNTGFGLPREGGSLALLDTMANGRSLLSSVNYGIQATGFSIGRIPNATGDWTLTIPSPQSANIPVTLGNPAMLKINEWMPAPGSGPDWFEIYNPNAQPVALGGLRLSDNLAVPNTHTIAPLSFIGGGTNGFLKFIADRDLAAGADHVDFKLDNTREAIGLFSTNGVLIDGIVYEYPFAGVSEGRFPDGSTNIVRFPGTASPGESNYRLLENIAINEVLSHSDPPLEDAIELVNLSDSPVDISGWWLSDSINNLMKFRIPNETVMQPHQLMVFYEYQFNSNPDDPLSFALSSAHGDQVYLSAASSNGLTGWRTSVKFGAAESGVSFGRYITSDGRVEFVPMSERTFGVDNPMTVEEFRMGDGSPNAYPKVGPVVLSEIMYHPPDLGGLDNTRDEYIQLKNITPNPVPLFDPEYPTNTWRLRNAVDFDFPQNITLPPGGTLIVVSFDPIAEPAMLDAFKAVYALTTNAIILGPWSGKLANSSETIELKKPDPPETNGFVPYVLVEELTYYSSGLWAVQPDGFGMSLHRVSPTGFANDPTNWVAGAPTPGPSGLVEPDSDNDGMPDSWETAYNLDPHNASDALLDADGDGMSNLQEFLAGTNPTNASSLLQITISRQSTTNPNPQLIFTISSNKTCTVMHRTNLTTGPWLRLFDVDAAATNQFIRIPIPANSQGEYFRLLVPRMP